MCIRDRDKRIDQIAAESTEEIKRMCEKLEKRYNHIESSAAKLFQEFNELVIDPRKGCAKVEKPHKQYQTGILTSHARVQRPSNLEVMLETPKWVGKYTRRKPLASSQKKRRLELTKSSSRKLKYDHKYPDSKDVIKEEAREEG
eukprot:TRINITY_DN16231_c0_g1_i1.p1 TRINITY_DN16231_c0_g1~~TRINITY_DN16231_c0_g1_i1.p1  ORF type:complete len:144 (+),score=27.73 TRINITY_DN16231_c0_g1_i1:129-560(+)